MVEDEQLGLGSTSLQQLSPSNNSRVCPLPSFETIWKRTSCRGGHNDRAVGHGGPKIFSFSHRGQMEKFLRGLKFSTQKTRLDVYSKLQAEHVTLETIQMIKIEEFEEIGISGEELKILMEGISALKVRTLTCILFFS